MTDEMGFSDAADDAEALKDVLDDLERRSRSFGSALTGALASATRGGKGLEDVLRSAGLRLTEIALSAGLKPLEGLLGSALSGLAGALPGRRLLPMAGYGQGDAFRRRAASFRRRPISRWTERWD